MAKGRKSYDSSPTGPTVRNAAPAGSPAPARCDFRGTLDRALGERIVVDAYDPARKPPHVDICKHRE